MVSPEPYSFLHPEPVEVCFLELGFELTRRHVYNFVELSISTC